MEASGGQTTADENDVRAAVTMKAIGRAKSWGAPNWQQKEIDRLLAVMWAIAQGGNFSLQLRQQNQPLTRAEGSVFAQAMLDAIGIEPHGREAYLNGICQRIHKCPLCDITDDGWVAVLAALNHTRLHKQGAAHSHPRSPWQARKSQRRGRSASVDMHVSCPTGGHSRTGSVMPQEEGEADF
ncbi:MAG: hypothetical protein ACREUC_13270 [Steroidobacteraceae bacterium]